MELEALILPLKAESKNFNLSIAGAAAGVTALIGTMGAAIKMTFNWADEMDSLQDVMGGTNKQAAALNFTLRKSGTATDTLAKGMVILEKSLVKSNGQLDTAGTALKNFGINIFDSNGGLKDQNVLLDEVALKYSEFGTQQEKVNYLTEVFGKSGAGLIDFFDTLAADGGIDVVAEKVEKLGLAIDPNRYEQFTRNIEELKLAGLGLAVGFTEQVMPMFERLMEIVTSGNIGPELLKLAGEFGTWVENIDWKAVTDKIVGGLNSVDWAKVGSNFAEGTKTAVGEIGRFLKEFGWWELGNSLASMANNLFFGLFGQTEASAQKIIKTTLNQIASDIEDWINKVKAYLSGLGFIDVNFKLTSLPKFDMSHNATGPNSNAAQAANTPGVSAGNYTYNPGTGQYTLNRASGGPVIAGQVYNVSEFNHAEQFTPGVSGRVDPIRNNQPVEARIDEDKLARILISALQQGALG
jgi:hypothetical protein